jgi:hypothetical protein
MANWLDRPDAHLRGAIDEYVVLMESRSAGENILQSHFYHHK